MIISFVNQKGGVGKSSLATNFACISAINKMDTILFDMDPQGSSVSFREKRPEDKPQFRAVSVLTPTLHRDINGFNFDIAFIDSGGRDSKLFRNAMFVSDLVLFPVLPGGFDLESLVQTLEIFEEVKATNDDIKTGVIFNRIKHGTIIAREARKAVDVIATRYEFEIFESYLGDLVGFVESPSSGLSIVEMSGEKYESGKSQIINLYKEVLRYAGAKV